jgi:hypothetical protein
MVKPPDALPPNVIVKVVMPDGKAIELDEPGQMNGAAHA